MTADALRQWRRQRKRRRLAIVGLVLALAVLGMAAAVLWPSGAPAPVRKVPLKLPRAASQSPVDPLNLPPPDLLKPVSPEEALKQNMQRPFSGRPDTPAAPFKLAADAESTRRALECLSQAVYYEAAGEGFDGQRAVAQIVLNRMRHSAYPATICGVVYQGAERTTGCQFTFTCDGSLARLPVPSLWKQAERVAREALAGTVFARVGHATHYHADYVLPYWADSLDKSVHIGRHIFYRLKGGLGAASAFSQRYGGTEPEPPPPSTVQVALEAVQEAEPLLTAPFDESALQAPAGELAQAVAAQPQLVADAMQGTLIIDGDSRPAVPEKRKPRPNADDSCARSDGSRQVRPMSATDARAQASRPSC